MPPVPPSDVPLRADYGGGSYRRSIVLEARPGTTRGELADDFHHFAASIDHDDAVVTAVRGEDIRFPWTTCPGAVAPLERLVGASLTSSLADIGRYTDPQAQCTHLYDVACLAITHAARNPKPSVATRRYDFVLPDRSAGRSHPTLHRNGESILEWEVVGMRINEARPDIFAHRALRGAAFGRLVAKELEPELAEAALVMRRAIFIGFGRLYDFDEIERARAFAPVVGAACHTFSPERVDQARRMRGSIRDFHATPERIFERDGQAD